MSKQKSSSLCILQVVPTLVCGGVERGTLDLALYLKNQYVKSFVASAGGPLVRLLEEKGIPHITLNLKSQNPWVIYKNIKKLIEIIHEEQVTILHVRSRAPAWSVYFAAKKCGVPFISTFHGAYGTKPFWKKMYNRMMTKGKYVIAVSQFIQNHLQTDYQVPLEKIRLIYRGIDLEAFNPQLVSAEKTRALRTKWHVLSSEKVILIPGRIRRRKGIHVVLKALKEMCLPHWKVLIVGGNLLPTTPYEKELDHQIKRHHLENKVFFVGSHEDMPAVYTLADVVISSSLIPESFGRVTAEAGAMGIPVIATAHGGSCEIVVPGETGWLYSPYDTKALTFLLEKALTLSPEERAKLALKARSHISENFSKDHMCAETLKVYRDSMADEDD
jgi:glycosyltransferase involved in cell wall biosynthesis